MSSIPITDHRRQAVNILPACTGRHHWMLANVLEAFHFFVSQRLPMILKSSLLLQDQAAATACLYKHLQGNTFKSVHDLASQMGEMMLGQCPRKRERSHIYFLEQTHKRSRAVKPARQGHSSTPFLKDLYPELLSAWLPKGVSLVHSVG